MKSILEMYPSLLLTILLGLGLSGLQSPMKSSGVAATSNEYSSYIDKSVKSELSDKIDVLKSIVLKQVFPITTLSFIVPSVHNFAFLATISALGMYTPALVGIGIMTSHVQANVGPGGGMSSKNSWKRSKINQRRRRAHPRDVSTTGPDVQDKNSYHVAEVLVKKFEDLVGQVNEQHTRFESPGRLPKVAALGKATGKKCESTDLESYHSSTILNDKLNVQKSADLKIRQDDSTPELKPASVVSGSSLILRDPSFKQGLQNFKHGCWGLGMKWNGKDCGNE